MAAGSGPETIFVTLDLLGSSVAMVSNFAVLGSFSSFFLCFLRTPLALDFRLVENFEDEWSDNSAKKLTIQC